MIETDVFPRRADGSISLTWMLENRLVVIRMVNSLVSRSGLTFCLVLFGSDRLPRIHVSAYDKSRDKRVKVSKTFEIK